MPSGALSPHALSEGCFESEGWSTGIAFTISPRRKSRHPARWPARRSRGRGGYHGCEPTATGSRGVADVEIQVQWTHLVMALLLEGRDGTGHRPHTFRLRDGWSGSHIGVSQGTDRGAADEHPQ